jgi:hypothetical protein
MAYQVLPQPVRLSAARCVSLVGGHSNAGRASHVGVAYALTRCVAILRNQQVFRTLKDLVFTIYTGCKCRGLAYFVAWRSTVRHIEVVFFSNRNAIYAIKI